MANLVPETSSSNFECGQIPTRADCYPESKEDEGGALGHDMKGTWREMWDFQDFKAPEVWMAALIELWVTGLNVFVSGATAVALSRQKNITSPFLLPLIGGILAGVNLSLFIFAALPASGGHINPLITLGSFAIRASSLPRTLIYIAMQTLGATAGASLLHAAVGKTAIASTSIPGCTWNPGADTTLLQVLVLESVACVVLLWVSFVAGLDPRQGRVFGRVLGPVVIGLTLGICIFITAVVKPGYTGASMNPARCFGLLAATGNFENHFVHWVGTMVAAGACGIVYAAMPPYRAGRVVVDAVPMSISG